MNSHLSKQTQIWGSVCVIIAFLSTQISCTNPVRRLLKTDHPEIIAPSLERVVVDDEASELIWIPRISISEAETYKIREQISKGIQRVFTKTDDEELVSTSNDQHTPIRYQLYVNALEKNILWTLIPCFAYLTLIGCPLGTLEASIILKVDLNGKIYKVNTSDYIFFGLYYQFDMQTRGDLFAVSQALFKALNILNKRIYKSEK